MEGSPSWPSILLGHDGTEPFRIRHGYIYKLLTHCIPSFEEEEQEKINSENICRRLGGRIIS